MDALTSFVLVTVMCLLNGAVLGAMHRDLPEALRPSAKTWRVGTLAIAGGAIVLGLQQSLPLAFALPVGNAMLVAGINGYWHALRQFDRRPPLRSIWAVPLLVAVLVWFFAIVHPSLVARVVLTSIAWLAGCAGCAITLLQGDRTDTSRSRRVLVAVVGFLALVMFARALYFTFGSVNEHTIIDPGSWVNGLTPMLAAALPILGTTAFLLMCSDRLRQQWERAASVDHLTGLSNRRTLSDSGAERIAEAKRLKLKLSLAVIDLDHFKQINDRHGHEVGDRALQHVAALLRATCRQDDLVSRQGGEEFVVIFARLDLEAASVAANRLRQAIEKTPLIHEALSLTITASLGVATLTEGDHALDDLVRRADTALYKAKSGGRNRVEVG